MKCDKCDLHLDNCHCAYTTCTFCDNLVYSKNGKLPQTPCCSPECAKKLIYKPKDDYNKDSLSGVKEPV